MWHAACVIMIHPPPPPVLVSPHVHAQVIMNHDEIKYQAKDQPPVIALAHGMATAHASLHHRLID